VCILLQSYLYGVCGGRRSRTRSPIKSCAHARRVRDRSANEIRACRARRRRVGYGRRSSVRRDKTRITDSINDHRYRNGEIFLFIMYTKRTVVVDNCTI